MMIMRERNDARVYLVTAKSEKQNIELSPMHISVKPYFLKAVTRTAAERYRHTPLTSHSLVTPRTPYIFQ